MHGKRTTLHLQMACSPLFQMVVEAGLWRKKQQFMVNQKQKMKRKEHLDLAGFRIFFLNKNNTK